MLPEAPPAGVCQYLYRKNNVIQNQQQCRYFLNSVRMNHYGIFENRVAFKLDLLCLEVRKGFLRKKRLGTKGINHNNKQMQTI